MAGSMALRLKADGLCRRVVALVRREDAAQTAMAQGAVDFASTNPAEALGQADLVIFATPVRVLLKQMQNYAPFFKDGAIITDMGSTKQSIITVMETLPQTVYPIGSHPMCGKEVGGLAAADPQLYEGATWVLTPLDRTPASVTKFVAEVAQVIGAKPLQLAAQHHDYLVSAISHTPYVLSSALVLAAKEIADDDPLVWQVAASGFRDTSRIAASQVDMMLDILLTNQDAVAKMLDGLQSQLDILAQAIAEGDESTLRQLLETARDQRRALYV